jgi:hypothetical protein
MSSTSAPRPAMRPAVRAAVRSVVRAATALALALGLLVPAGAAQATPVCTDGFEGGPPLALCGGRIFPEAAGSTGYVQWNENALGFSEFVHGIRFLAQQYPRWVSVTTLAEFTGNPLAVSAGADGFRSTDARDTGDGRPIHIIKLTDHEVPDEGKETLSFSLSVHGNERGGLEGGLRAVEDLAMDAEDGGTIVDGVDNYTSNTGREPVFNEYEVADVLAQQAVYFVDLNVDGWANAEIGPDFSGPYARGNGEGTDLNRQMPTIGWINPSENPLRESETRFGLQAWETIAEQGVDGLMAYGADIHGELTSRAYVDIMYPAGEFDSVDHRRLMAIAERTKSVIDATLYEGIQNEIEEATGGNESEGLEEIVPVPGNTIPTMPAHWATVWDTLGYTDTGFIGDYLATDLAVTGMDYEIFLNHTAPERAWTVYLQENHINASRAIIKTAMAYAMTQTLEFNDENVVIDPVGRAGFVFNPVTVSSTDADGAGTPPQGPGPDGEDAVQADYDVTGQQWFLDTNRLMGDNPFVPVLPADIAADSATLDHLDTLVVADTAAPVDAEGRDYDVDAYWASIGDWVSRGGNLVLTDRAVHGLAELGVVPAEAVTDVRTYLPYANFVDLDHPMATNIRNNGRQLVDSTLLGYNISNTGPMTVVDTAAFEAGGGEVVGTTGNATGSSDDGSRTSIGQVPLGAGQVRIVGGALPIQTEEYDHRFGLRNYAMTYSGLFVMENAIRHDAQGLGIEVQPVVDAAIPAFGGVDVAPGAAGAGQAPVALTSAAGLALAVALLRRRRAA